MAETVSLPDWTTQASIEYETEYGHVDLRGVFLWVVAALILLVLT